MGGFLGKDKLIFDPTAPADGDNVGAYIASSDGTLITHTTFGAVQALDVNVANTTPISVSNTANHIEDDPHVSGDIGSFALGVRNDTNAVLTDNDLDYSPIAVDSMGRLKVVADLTVTSDFVYPEDSPHVSGDQGAYVLSVRQDVLTSSVSTDGDYASFKINDRGALWTAPVGTVADDAVDTENPVKIGSRAVSGALVAISTTGDRANVISDMYRRVWINDSPNIGVASTAVSIDTTAGGTALPTTAQAGRRRIMIQNLGTKDIYIGPTGVTSASGIRCANGATMALEVGQNIALFAIAASGTQDVRVFELA